MSRADLAADVDATIAQWRHRYSPIPATIIWQQLGNDTRKVTWKTIRTFMLGWLARAERTTLTPTRRINT